MRYLLPSILVPLVLVAGGSPALAQAGADEKELANYRLTMEAIRKVDRAMEAAVAEMRKDPRLQERMKLEAEIAALEKKDERTEAEEERLEQLRQKQDEAESEEPDLFGDAETLTELAAAIAKEPIWARALGSVGLSAREYAKVSLCLMQAMMAAGMKQSGLAQDLPKTVLADNVRFVEEHEAELQALQKKWEALGKEPLEVYVVGMQEPADALAEYIRLTGRPVMPPRWVLGYLQSHRTLAGPQEPLQIAKTFRDRKLPCDGLIYLGTGYCPAGWNVGHGTLDWPGLVKALKEKTATRLYVMEHDNPSDAARFARRSLEAARKF